MKGSFRKVGIGRLFEVFRKTGYAYCGRIWFKKKQYSDNEIFWELLLQLRREAPGLVTPAIYHQNKAQTINK